MTNARWIAYTQEAWRLYPDRTGFSQKNREDHLAKRLEEDADRAVMLAKASRHKWLVKDYVTGHILGSSNSKLEAQCIADLKVGTVVHREI